jgi:DNA-binding FrmR family transcriptional regulator
MAHTIKNKDKLVARIRRIRGQVNAIEKSLEDEKECSDILNVVASCRGALNGLMSELIEDHVMMHVLDHQKKPSVEQARAAEQLLSVLKAYLK